MNYSRAGVPVRVRPSQSGTCELVVPAVANTVLPVK
jgi:hypothetical protein